jgi:transposase
VQPLVGDREADAGLIRAADPELRRVFVEAAWVLIRCQPRWRQLALRLKAQGKPSTVVTAAVANRFVLAVSRRRASAGRRLMDRSKTRAAGEAPERSRVRSAGCWSKTLALRWGSP